MAKRTKKSLKEALQPLRKEAERQGMIWMNGGRPMLAPIQWEGFKIKCTLIRRARVVCNVPFPYAAMELQYELIHPYLGVTLTGASGVGEFVDRVFTLFLRQGVR